MITCLFHRAKLVCSSNFLFCKELDYLKTMFNSNGYPNWFFEKCLRSFNSGNNIKSNLETTVSNDRIYRIVIPFLGKESRRFVINLQNIINSKLNLSIKLNPVYKTFKVSNYFQLKSRVPSGLCSNVVYEFSCSCDTNLTYLGMSTRHLSTRIREHLNFNSQTPSAVQTHLMSCDICSKVNHKPSSFKIIKKCNSEFQTKIYEALLIRKRNPALNRQLFAIVFSIECVLITIR